MSSRHFLLLCLTCLWLAWRQASPAATPLRLIDSAAALDVAGAQTSDPALASDNGARISCAWISRRNARESVIYREHNGDQWQTPSVFAGAAGTSLGTPFLFYDRLLQPHVIWRETDAQRMTRLIHASRQSNYWMVHGPLLAPTSSRVADPSAIYDAYGQLHVTWREGNGSFWSIKAADAQSSGTLKISILSDEKTAGLNLYPTIMATPFPRIQWFAQNNGQFHLRESQLAILQQRWQPVATFQMEALPVNRLPFLFGSPHGGMNALWVDSFKGMERVFWGIGDAQTRGAGMPVDEAVSAPGSQPFGQYADAGPLIAWRGETDKGPVVCVRRQEAGLWGATITLDAPYATQPRVVGRGNAACVVWISDASDGGDGNIHAGFLQ